MSNNNKNVQHKKKIIVFLLLLCIIPIGMLFISITDDDIESNNNEGIDRKAFLDLGGNVDFIDSSGNSRIFLFLELNQILSLSKLWEINSTLYNMLFQAIIREGALYHNGLPINASLKTSEGWNEDTLHYYDLDSSVIGNTELENFQNMHKACELLENLNISGFSEVSVDTISSLIVYPDQYQDFEMGNFNELGRFLAFIEERPDCLNLLEDLYRPYQKNMISFGGMYKHKIATYDFEHISKQNARALWFYLLQNYGEETIDKYYYSSNPQSTFTGISL